MATYTGTITKKTFNILPSRLEFFTKRMKTIESAANAAIPPIPFSYTDPSKVVAKTIPLDPILIGRAKANLIPDCRQLSNGDWVRDVLPITVEYGELNEPNLEYIGFIKYAEVADTSTGQIIMKREALPEVIREIGMTDAEYEQRVTEVTPELVRLGQQFNSMKDLNCEHCSQTGDNVDRHIVYVVRATKDHQRWGKKNKFKMNLKKGQLVQVGSFCMKKYSGLDVKALAAFYELDRKPTPAGGTNGSPQNPAGWGYKEMGVWDYAERMVQYYNQREAEWLSARNQSLWQIASPDILYSKGTLGPLIDRKISYVKDPDTGRQVKPKVETGCFVETKGNHLMKGRQFNMWEADPSKDAQWFIQPYTGKGSVVDMMTMWEDGLDEAREYMTVPLVNMLDGSVELDPATGDILTEQIPVPSTDFIQRMVRHDWRLKIVPIFAPATDSKFVKKTLNGMMDWLEDLTPSGMYGDLQVRLKAIKNLGYVGEKTKNEFCEVWRMYMFHTFDRRKKLDFKNQTKKFQKIGSDELESKYPDAKWYSFAKDKAQRVAEYTSPIYITGSSYRWQRMNDFNKAYSPKFLTVFLTPQQWADFPAWETAKIAEELADRMEREARRKYNDAVQDIYRSQRQSWPYPNMRSIPYAPSPTEFLEVMGWTALNEPDRFDLATRLFTVNGGAVRTAYLKDDQLAMVQNKFRPQIVGTPTVTPTPTITPPPAPTPASATPPAPLPVARRYAVTKAEARRKDMASRQTSRYEGTSAEDSPTGKGDIIPLVEGWVTWISTNTFGCQVPGVSFQNRPECRSIALVSPEGIKWQIFHLTASHSQPKIGQYYNLFNVEIEKHDTYNGCKQNVIQDPDDRLDLEFVNATEV